MQTLNQEDCMSERDQVLSVNYTMKYLVKDGQDITPEMTETAYGVLSGIAQVSDAGSVPRVSALHTMALILSVTGEVAFASHYIRMTDDQINKMAFYDDIDIQYA